MMIETTKYYGELSLSIEELPDIFLMFLGLVIPLASIACLSLGFGIILRRTNKKKYAFLLSSIGIILLSILVPSFVYGSTRLIETSLGVVQGEALLPISVGAEEIMMSSSWGFAVGFYLVGIGIFAAVIAVLLDIRVYLGKRIKQGEKS
jgi:hypothetical protein